MQGSFLKERKYFYSFGMTRSFLVTLSLAVWCEDRKNIELYCHCLFDMINNNPKKSVSFLLQTIFCNLTEFKLLCFIFRYNCAAHHQTRNELWKKSQTVVSNQHIAWPTLRQNGNRVGRSRRPCNPQFNSKKMDDESLCSSGGGSAGVTTAGITNNVSQDASPDQLVLFRIYVPELNVEKCLQFHKEELIWEVKQQCLTSLPKVRCRSLEIM